MKMKKKNWDACGSACGPEPQATIGFFKKIDHLTFTKDQWEYFKETIDWMFNEMED